MMEKKKICLEKRPGYDSIFTAYTTWYDNPIRSAGLVHLGLRSGSVQGEGVWVSAGEVLDTTEPGLLTNADGISARNSRLKLLE